MLSKKTLSASQTAASAPADEVAQASGTSVSNTLLPSTVVCYTNGVSDTYEATSIQGYYRAVSGNLYSSTTLFSPEGTGTADAYQKGTTHNSTSSSYNSLNDGYYDDMGYDAYDFPLIVYQVNSTDARWQCNWVRDHLPAHLDSNTDSLCIELFVNNWENYKAYSRLVSASGWKVDAPAGFELNYRSTSDTVLEQSHNWGDGSSNRVGDFYESVGQEAWVHYSWLWDFENARVSHHRNGNEEYSSTNSNLPTAANWTTADGGTYSNIDTLLLGYDSGEHDTNKMWAYYAEVIISVDDSTKQARYGSSFTPSTTPLIQGGS
tara:strand:- start:11035 stop:11994 length:960 start_codon:yes stop_codon:yes gene_type:complete